MRNAVICLLMAGVVLAGCSKDNKQTQQNAQPPAQQVAPPPAVAQQPATPPASEPIVRKPPKPRPPAEEPAKPAAPQWVMRMVPITSGTELVPLIDAEISTKTYQAGEAFSTTLREGYSRNGVVLLPAGSKIRGTVTAVKRAGRVGGKAEMTLEFKDLVTPEGMTYPLSAQPIIIEGKGTASGDIAKTVGGAAGGAIIGGLLGGKKDIGKGAAAGGAAGAAWAIATRGNDIVLDPGSPIKVTLTREFDVQVQMKSDQPLP